MPPNRFESEVESFLEGSHGDRTHIKRADHHTVTPLCGTLLPGFRVGRVLSRVGPSGPPAGRVLYRFGPPGFRVGRVLSRRWSCVRYKVLPARLASAVGVKKFSLQARNGLVSPFCGVLGEFCPGWVHRGRLLGEFYTGSIRRLSCGESFVPVVHLTCGAGGVLSRSSGETARSEGGARPAGPGRASRRRAERSSRRGRRAGGQASHRTEIWQASRRAEVWRGAPSEARWDGGCGAGGHGRPIGGVRGLRGMYLRCRRAAARSEGGARPAGPGRASRRRAERSSRRGRRAGGQASRRTGGLAGCAARRSGGWVPRGRRAGGPPPTGA